MTFYWLFFLYILFNSVLSDTECPVVNSNGISDRRKDKNN